MRTMNFVRFFREYGEVDIAYSFKTVQEISGNGLFSNEYLLKKKGFPNGLREHFSNFLNGIPYPIREYCRNSQELLESLLRTKGYDYILVRYVFSAVGLMSMGERLGLKVVMDFDDVLSGSLYETRFSTTESHFRKFLRNLNKKLLQHYEKRCFGLGASLFCSEGDKKKIVPEKYQKDSFVVPNIYDNAPFENYDFGDGLNYKNTLLFVGTLNYAPNVEGLKWFVESVYHTLRQEYPDTELLVVGRSPSEEVKELCEVTKGIQLHADAPDIKEYYKQCGVVVVPLLAGGGTRIKILEAALAGRPILSTLVGAEGLDVVDERDFLLFENYSDFLNKFEKLHNENFYKSLITSAKKLVLDRYSRQTFENAMKQVLFHIDNKIKT